ncbi:MAG: type II secretion system protein [Armatimonadetes bacterium]|nr:MAG: type II secretion system protein [Armatimonadota bacterium]
MNCRVLSLGSSTLRAFSMLELMAGIAIFAILAGVLLPVFAGVKRNSQNVTSMSNLRQTGMALLLYADAWGGVESMPPYEAAVGAVAQAPTCDPKDFWRSDCSVASASPLLGSYGYARAIVDNIEAASTTFQGKPISWASYSQQEKSLLLIDPFYADERPCPFVSYPYDPQTDFEGLLKHCKAKGYSLNLPSKLLRLRLDGSAEVKRLSKNNWLGIHWANALL